MDGPRNHLLPGTAFAGDQHGRIRRRNSLEPIDQVLHLGACEDNPFIAEFFIQATPKLDIGLLQLELND